MKPIFLIFFCITIFSCNKKQPIKLDKSKIVIIPAEGKNFKPTDEELFLVEQLVNKRLSIHNEEQKASNQDRKYFFGDSLQYDYESKIIEYKNYYRQLEAFYNDKGEKIVVLNCLCDIENFTDWRKAKIEVKDGGSCFFQITVNINLRIVYGFTINGEA